MIVDPMFLRVKIIEPVISWFHKFVEIRHDTQKVVFSFFYKLKFEMCLQAQKNVIKQELQLNVMS